MHIAATNIYANSLLSGSLASQAIVQMHRAAPLAHCPSLHSAAYVNSHADRILAASPAGTCCATGQRGRHDMEPLRGCWRRGLAGPGRSAVARPSRHRLASNIHRKGSLWWVHEAGKAPDGDDNAVTRVANGCLCKPITTSICWMRDRP